MSLGSMPKSVFAAIALATAIRSCSGRAWMSAITRDENKTGEAIMKFIRSDS